METVSSYAIPLLVRDTARKADEQAEEEPACIGMGAVLSSEGNCLIKRPLTPAAD